MATIIKDDESVPWDDRKDEDGSPPPSPSPSSSSAMDEKDDKDKPLSKTTLQRHRTRIVMLHFMLYFPRYSLAIWSYLASKSVPLSPQLSDVAGVPYEKMQNFTKAESNAYYECTANAFGHLNEEMDEAVKLEYETLVAHNQFNLALLAEVDSTTGTCAIAGLKAREALYSWNTTDSQPLPFLNFSSNGVCTFEDRDYIASSLGQDFAELENEVSSTVGGYVHSSESSLGRIKDYAEERVGYDYDYFVRDRIEPLLELLQKLAETGISPVQFAFRPQILVDRLLEHLTAFDVTLSHAKIRINLLTARIEDFYVSLEKFVEAYNDMHMRLVKARTFILEYLPDGGVKIPDFLKLDGVPFASSLLPPAFEIPRFETDLADFDILLGDFSEQALLLIVELVQKLEEAATRALAAATKEILDQILALLTLEDYDPPKFKGSQPEISTLEEEASYLSDIGNAAEERTQQALEKVKGLRNTPAGGISIDIPELKSGNYSFSGNATTFDYQNAELPNIRLLFLWLNGIVAFLASRQGIVEISVQVFRFNKSRKKYERGAVPETQEVGAGRRKRRAGTGGGDDDDEDDGEDGEGRIGGYECIMKSFKDINVVFLGLIGVLLLLFVIVHFAASSWYQHVNNSCVVSQNGTSHANTFFVPIMLNQASASGNALHTRSEFACLERQNLICERMRVETGSAYNHDAISLSIFLQRYNESNEWISRLGRCIDTDVLDGQFSEACCGLEGYPTNCAVEPVLRPFQCPIDELVYPPASFRTIGTYLSEPTCFVNASDWILKDSRFDCQSLQDKCSSTVCTGINKDLIRSMAIEADCLVQLYFLRLGVFLLLVVYHAVMLNIFLKLIFDGLRNVLWKMLNPEVYVRAKLHPDGDINDKAKSKGVRAKKVRKADKKRVFNGWRMLIGGLVVLVFWIVSFFFIHEQTTEFR